MIHYTCDRCKRVLDAGEDLRYVLKIEAFAAMEPLDTSELDEDRDHLAELHDLLETYDEEPATPLGDDIYQKSTYDLCPECYRKFARNPLGGELVTQLDFSNN